MGIIDPEEFVLFVAGNEWVAMSVLFLFALFYCSLYFI